MEFTEILLWLGAVLCLAAGLAGLILPAIPGPPLLFAAALLAAWAEDFVHVAGFTLTLLGVLALLGVIGDFVAGALGAKKFGASPRAISGAMIGAVVGMFFGLPGILLGPFIGAAIGEFGHSRNVPGAGMAGVGATVGVILGTAAKVAVGIAMLASYTFVRFS